MLTVKVKTITSETDKPKWEVFSVVKYTVDNKYTEDGVLEEWVDMEDYKGSWHTIDILEGVTVYFENLSGKTIQTLSK